MWYYFISASSSLDPFGLLWNEENSFDKLNIQYKTGIQIRKDEYALYSCRAVRVFLNLCASRYIAISGPLLSMVHFACFSFRAIAVCAFLKWTLTRAIADFTSWPALYMVGERGDVFPLGLQQLASQFMCVGGGFYHLVTHPSLTLALDWVILGYFAVCYSTPAITVCPFALLHIWLLAVSAKIRCTVHKKNFIIIKIITIINYKFIV